MRLLIYFTLLFSAAFCHAERSAEKSAEKPAEKSTEQSTQQSAEMTKARDHINSMEYTEAAASLRQHLQTNTDDIKALRLLAKTYAWDNNYKLANQTYDQLLKTEPDRPEYLFGKGTALVWLQKNEQAITFLDQAWNAQTNNSNYLKILILTLNQTGTEKNKQRAKELSAIGQKEFPNLLWD